VKDNLNSRIKQFIIDRLQLTISPDEFSDDTVIFDETGPLGLDSIDALELVVGLEKEFGASIPDRDVAQKVLVSVNSIAEFIRGRGES
jgi:acyl carrier protein